MTEETYIKAQNIVIKIHDLQKKIETLKKKNKSLHKIICCEKYCDTEDIILIPSDIVDEISEEVINVFEKRLRILKKELELL